MKKLALITTLITLSSTPAFATQIKVVKSTGQKAIVEFPKGTTPKAGETFTLSTGGDLGDEGGGGGGGGGGGRANFIGLSSNFNLSLDTGGGFNMSPIIDAQFGWNMGQLEFGPSLSLSKANGGDFAFGAGILIDFNFSKNDPGTFFVPALTAHFDFDHAGGNVMSFGGGLAGKIFCLRQSTTAIRLNAAFELVKTDAATSKAITILGAGLETYF